MVSTQVRSSIHLKLGTISDVLGSIKDLVRKSVQLKAFAFKYAHKMLNR